MTIVRAHGNVIATLQYTRRFEGGSEHDVIRFVSEVFECLVAIYRPAVLRAHLDSFVPDELGMAEDAPLKVAPIGGFAIERGCPIAPRYTHDSDLPRTEYDRLTPRAIAEWLTDLVTGARSLGEGRPGLYMLEARAGAARFPEHIRSSRSSIEFQNNVSWVVSFDPDGFAQGPALNGQTPAPIRIYVYRENWQLIVNIEILWDVFLGNDSPFVPEVQACIDCLVARGWTKTSSSGA